MWSPWVAPFRARLLVEAEMFGNVCRHPWVSRQGAGAVGIWWVETRMLLDTLRAPDGVTAKNYLAPTAPRLTKPAMAEHLSSPPSPLLASRRF